MENFKRKIIRNVDFTLIFLFSMIFLLFLTRVNIGLDLSDGGYSLARYRLFSGDGLDNNFFLSNKLGSLILKVYNRAVFLRFISYFIYSSLSVIAYFYWKNIIKSKFICALSSLISLVFALSFPLEILHNSITALLLFVIYIVFVKFEKKKDKKYLILLSILSTVSILFRVSNVVFIFSISMYLYLYDRSNLKYYVLYLLIQIIFIFLVLFAIGKFDKITRVFNYLIFLLFNDTDHNILKLIFNISLNAVFIFIPIIIIKKYSRIYDNKISNLEETYLMIIFFILLLSILSYLFFDKSDVFLINSIFYKLFLISLYSSFLLLLDTRISKNPVFKIAIFLFCSLTFGTANLFYYNRICMFLVIPIWFFRLMEFKIKKKYVYYVGYVVSLISVLTLTFIFPYRDEAIFNLKYETNIPQLSGIKTSYTKANSLNKVKRVLSGIDWKEHRLITNGSIPIMSYISNAYSVHNTTWPDLPSYSLKKYKQEIELVTKKIVIVDTKFSATRNYWEFDENYDSQLTEKEKVLKEEIAKRKMKKIYEDDFFRIWK